MACWLCRQGLVAIVFLINHRNIVQHLGGGLGMFGHSRVEEALHSPLSLVAGIKVPAMFASSAIDEHRIYSLQWLAAISLPLVAPSDSMKFFISEASLIL